MTDDEAKELREQLSKHHGDRLFTVREFCDMFRQWSDVASSYLEERYGLTPAIISSVFLVVNKSSLLGRMFYGREKVRTRKCPTHDGIWCGCFINCPCSGTGWLPEDE